jgi:SAM-dependent methyltransferase
VSNAQSYYDEYWGRPEPPPLADPLAPRRLELLERRLREAGARRVLDAGSGVGDLVADLVARGFDAMGIEVSPRAVELAASRHPGCTFLRHSIEDVPWPVDPASFDAVVSFEVVEHLLDPRRLFEGARGALASGGLLVVSTPYHGLLKNLALVALRFDEHFDVQGDHIRFFSDHALERMAAATGFEVEGIEHLGRGWPVWANSLLFSRAP